MSDWIKNAGTRPKCKRVDIRLNCDEPNWPGVQCERYDQDPRDWAWGNLEGIVITHFREAMQDCSAADRSDKEKA